MPLPCNDLKCNEMIWSFIMHECKACNQTKLCCSLAGGNEIMMMFFKNECIVGFKFSKSELGALISLHVICDLVS